MRFLSLKPNIFKRVPWLRIFFVVGRFNFLLSKAARIKKERRQLLRALRLKSQQIKMLHQVHSSRAFYIPSRKGINFLNEERRKGDGLYTDKSGIFLAIRSADCLPILFYNDKAKIVGAIHAGFRGTAKRIVQKTIRKVCKKFVASPRDFYFYFGPAAQVCHYDVPKARLKFFDKRVLPKIIRRDGGKIYLNFVKANFLQLQGLGVKSKQIENSGICTIHDLWFPSHRREKEKRSKTILSIIGRLS